MILLFVWFYSSVSAEIWSKCSKPCGTGEQINELGLKRKCNFEDCSVYDGRYSILTDGRMNDLSKWKAQGKFFKGINPLQGETLSVFRAYSMYV